MLVKIGKYIGFCLYRRSYLLWSPVIVECEINKEERDVLVEAMGNFDGCDMEEFDKLESSEKTIAILGDRWWPQTAEQEGDKINKHFYVNI